MALYWNQHLRYTVYKWAQKQPQKYPIYHFNCSCFWLTALLFQQCRLSCSISSKCGPKAHKPASVKRTEQEDLKLALPVDWGGLVNGLQPVKDGLASYLHLSAELIEKIEKAECWQQETQGYLLSGLKAVLLFTLALFWSRLWKVISKQEPNFGVYLQIKSTAKFCLLIHLPWLYELLCTKNCN